jgi:hypothetical protein
MHSADLKWPGSEDRLVDGPGATANGDASYVTDIRGFKGVVPETSRIAIGSA